MAAKPNFKSDASEAIHSSASALFKVGAIDKATMRDFDESCLAVTPVITPATLTPAKARPSSGRPGPKSRAAPP